MTQLSNLTSYLRKAKANGLEIKTVYDVGACIGRWTHAMKQGVLFDADFYIFEGNPAYKDILSQQNTFVHIGILSNPGRDSVQFYNGTDTGDSYYKETTDHYDNRTPITLPCRTLDTVIEEHNLPLPQFLKIDTQGSELDIMAGAKKVMSHADLIYLECPIIEFNSRAPNIFEYLMFMSSHGFVPTDVLEIHRAEEILLQIDIMFIRAETKDKLFGQNVHIRPFGSKR
jgi:FkbM family methyltransferase